MTEKPSPESIFERVLQYTDADDRTICLDEMRKKRDVGLIPEAMYDELRGDKTIMEYVRSDAYPFEEVLAIALVASERKTGNVYKLEKAMKNEHPVIRYWGAVGCSALAHHKVGLPTELLEKLLEDESAAVRITAAEALGRDLEGTPFFEKAIAAIKKELGTKHDMIVLHALNALDQLGEEAKLDKAEIALIKKNKLGYSNRMAEKAGHH